MTEAVATPAEAHARVVIGGIVGRAVRDAGAAGVLLLEPDWPETRLLSSWLSDAAVVHTARAVESGEGSADATEAEEFGRARARVLARRQGLVLAHPACRTVLLLSRAVPPERLLPLGDVAASTVNAWAGGVSLPADVRELADLAGGTDRLDRALDAWLQERRPLEAALAGLPAAARGAITDRLRLNRSLRRWPRCVPKLSRRTLWIDLFA